MKDTLKYLIEKINNSELKKVEGLPYWYLEIENIWPDDFYQQILNNIPQDKSIYRPLSSKYKDRFKYELGYGENCDKPLAKLENMSGEQKSFWKSFQQHFVVDNQFTESVLNKYKEYIHWDSLHDYKQNCRLSKDLKGYSIGVHSDRRNKVFSALFYTPKNYNESMKYEWGTQILKPKKNNHQHNSEIHSAYNTDGTHNEFELYKWIECKPNSFFSWVVTQQSYHGVPPIKIEGVRDSIAFFVKATGNWKSRKLYGE